MQNKTTYYVSLHYVQLKYKKKVIVSKNTKIWIMVPTGARRWGEHSKLR